LKHDVSPGAGGIEVTLYQYDCDTPVASDDAVYIVDSLTSLGDDDVAEYVVEFDKANIGSSELLVGSDELNFCVTVGLQDAGTGSILVYRSSKLKLTFDLSYALFFLEVTGAPADYHDLEDVALFQMNACVCSVLFTCDTEPPLLQENTFVSVCLWPSSPGVQFVDFNMDIEGNGYSYSPIAIENGAQVTDGFTALQSQGDMWRVTTKLLPGLFVAESSLAEISGGGYLEFVTSKDVMLKDEKEFTLVVELGESVEETEDCLFSRVAEKMGYKGATLPLQVVGNLRFFQN